MRGIFGSIWITFVYIAVGLALVAAVAGNSAAVGLAGQVATYGGIGAGVTAGSIGTFFDNFGEGRAAVGDGAVEPAPLVP